MKPTEFKQFHNDLKASIVASVPIEIDNKGAEGGRLTIAELSRLESLMRPHLTGNEIAGNEIAGNEALKDATDLQPELPDRYWAALQVFRHTHTMLPVLEGLTTRQLARQQVSKILRWSFIYLCILLLVAFLGLSIFTSRVVPSFDNMRADLLLPPAITGSDRLDVTSWLPIIVSVLGASLVMLVIWMLAGGATKMAMGLGGRYYVRFRTSTTTLRIIQLLVASGVPVQQATSISCKLTGADAKVHQDIQTAVQGSGELLHVETLADCWMNSANQRLAYMKVATPVVLVSTVGGGIALLYCLAIFWPIISMLNDLPTQGM